MVAGERAARLSPGEAAQLAETLWTIGSTTRRRGAIAIGAALKIAAHSSEYPSKVDVGPGDVGAVQQALDEMPGSDNEEHGLDDLGKAIH